MAWAASSKAGASMKPSAFSLGLLGAARRLQSKLNPKGSRRRLERETGFEPATSTLARSHSTTELFPHQRFFILRTAYPNCQEKADRRLTAAGCRLPAEASGTQRLVRCNTDYDGSADGACEARSRQEEEDDAWSSSTTTNAEIVHKPHLQTRHYMSDMVLVRLVTSWSSTLSPVGKRC